MTDWNAMTLAALEARHPDAVWTVLPGDAAPEGMPVCMDYPSLSAARASLETAGFGPTRHGVALANQPICYDWTTAIRLSAGNQQDVVLVRRLQS